MQSQTRAIDGITMRWEEAGTGFPVVLIHGIPTSPALWRHVVPRITGARCLAWEMVGYGASIPEGEGRDISVARQADYLVAWLAALGIERAILAGHDLGGGVAQIAAVRHPEVCAGLFLTNAIGYDSWPIPSVKAMQIGDALVQRTPEPALRLMMTTLYSRGHDDAEQAREALDVHWSHYARHGAGAALARQVAALKVEDTLAIADALPGLGVPARLVWGVADQFQPIAYGERFARDLKAPLVRVEGGKHFMPEDHPEEIAAALSELVAEAGRAPGASAGGAGDDGLARARAALASLSEVMPDAASAEVKAIYEDIQAVLRVPFVNFLFRALANDAAYLARAWAHLRPILLTQDFENRAAELRALTRPAPAAREATDWEALGDADRARAFTESIDYVLPKLLLIAMLLDRVQPGGAGEASGASIPEGVAEAAEKVPMVEAADADAAVQALFDDIRTRHDHPTVATYFRSLGQWPDLLGRAWEGLRPQVGEAPYAEARAALIRQAEVLVRDLPAPDFAAPGTLGTALSFFHRRLVPDLMLDVGIVRAMLAGDAAESRNRLDLSAAPASG